MSQNSLVTISIMLVTMYIFFENGSFTNCNQYVISFNLSLIGVSTSAAIFYSLLYRRKLLKTMEYEGVKNFVMANWTAIGSVILPNLGGWANGLYFAGQVRKEGQKTWYDDLKKAPWNPPKWVFGPAWTALYSGMGYASYLVYNECGGFQDEAVLPLSLYGGQLLLNWAWTPIFFGMRDYKMAFVSITVLTGAALATTISFFSVSQKAGALMVPYVAWLAYATSLSYYIWKNNPQVEVKEIKDEKSQ